jgi:hypothetical protein
MDALNLPETCDALPSLSVLVSQLMAYRTTGSLLHLAHAARALDETRAELHGLHSQVARSPARTLPHECQQ